MKWYWALAALTLVRLAVASAMPLSADEAYYWTWSTALAPGYLDHPPMVALWIRAGTALLGDTALGVRLLAPLSAAAGSWLLASAAARLYPGRGVAAAALLNGTLLLGAGGVTMTPDTPLLLFWTATLAVLVRIGPRERGGVGRGGALWLVVGALAGCAMASKYTGAMLGIGIVLWLVIVPEMRGWFRSGWLWAGGAVAALVFAPVVMWNQAHGWASFAKQGGRAGDFRPAAALGHLAELLGGQVALATPWIFVLLAAGVVWVARRTWSNRARMERGAALLAAMTIPGLLVFVQHAVGDRVQANWPAIVYPGAAIAAAGLGWLWRGPVALGLALTAIVYVQATLAPIALPRRLDPTLIRLAGWDGLARDVAALDPGPGFSPAPGFRPVPGFTPAFVASENYGVAALLAWEPGLPAIAVEPRWRLFNLPQATAGQTGLVVVSERRAEPPDPAYWSGVTEIGRVTRGRAGVEAEAYRVYRATLRQDAPAVMLPSRGHR